MAVEPETRKYTIIYQTFLNSSMYFYAHYSVILNKPDSGDLKNTKQLQYCSWWH